MNASAFEINPKLIQVLRNASKVVAITGAGISAESNIPTFRDAITGLWARFKPEELATPEAFARDPKLVWDWYRWRYELVAEAEPNPGHQALAEMEDMFAEFLLITQNVDSLHERAGNKRVVELHGNLSRIKCSVDGEVVAHWQEGDQAPPLCPRCGGLLRPDVVWFGESLPTGALEQAADAALHSEVFLSIGTSSVVQPAASLIYYAVNNGATTVEINPNPTSQAGLVSYVLQGPAGVVLPALVAAVKG